MKSQSRALKLTLRFMGSCAPQPHMCAWRAPTPYDPLLRLLPAEKSRLHHSATVKHEAETMQIGLDLWTIRGFLHHLCQKCLVLHLALSSELCRRLGTWVSTLTPVSRQESGFSFSSLMSFPATWLSLDSNTSESLCWTVHMADIYISFLNLKIK